MRRADRPALGTVALLAALAAGQAAAQAPEFDPAETEACLAEPETAAGKTHCVGLSAVACMAVGDGQTTVGMGYCLDRERAFWDARLNDVYGRLMAIERAQEAEMAELGASVPSAATALRDMQRTWIAYRDAACAYEATQWGGGTGAGPAAMGCLMTLTGHQALALETRLSETQMQ